MIACGAVLALIGAAVEDEDEKMREALKALEKLKAQGLISDEEYERERGDTG